MKSRVHSVFAHALNLQVGSNELITLTNQGEVTPMGLLVDRRDGFNHLFSPGQELILRSDGKTGAGRTLCIALQDAQLWHARLWRGEALRSRQDFERISARLTNWLASQPQLGLLPLLGRLLPECGAGRGQAGNHHSRYIAEDLHAFTAALLALDWREALELTDKLIGFGLGSTPSCDDFLAAYLLVLESAAQSCGARFDWVGAFNGAVAAKAAARTTFISANMLRHAACGKTALSHQLLLRACLFEGEYDLIGSASQVLWHGASSGGDFLLGLVCALDWFGTQVYEIIRKGESAQVRSIQPQLAPTI